MVIDTHPEAPLVLDLSAQVQVHRGHQQSVPVTRVTRVWIIVLHCFCLSLFIDGVDHKARH